MSDETTIPQSETPAEEVRPGLGELLKKLDGAPSQSQIDAWKAAHGQIFVSGFDEEDLYVWRPITRKEWRELQVTVQDPEQKMNNLDFEEQICLICILWRSSPASFEQKGGTASTLHEQILQNSNFMAPQAASMLVARL